MGSFFWFVVLWVVVAAVVVSSPVPLGVGFEKGEGLPVLRLPYGTWRAASYRELSDM